MVGMRHLPASGFRRSPWKNGGGETTEIAAFPEGAGLDDFRWRISMAKVAVPGPFSIFPGIDRTLCVLTGEAITLAFEGRASVRLDRASAPYGFPADIAVSGEVSGAGITDLNVMSRRGHWRHLVERLSGTGSLTANEGLLVLVARRGDWLVNGTALPAGDSAILEAPGRVELAVSGGEAELYAVWLTPA